MTKPKINELVEAMQAFGIRNIRNITCGFFNQTAFTESKQLLQTDLEKLGIADMFDWTEDEN